MTTFSAGNEEHGVPGGGRGAIQISFARKISEENRSGGEVQPVPVRKDDPQNAQNVSVYMEWPHSESLTFECDSSRPAAEPEGNISPHVRVHDSIIVPSGDSLPKVERGNDQGVSHGCVRGSQLSHPSNATRRDEVTEISKIPQRKGDTAHHVADSFEIRRYQLHENCKNRKGRPLSEDSGQTPHLEIRQIGKATGIQSLRGSEKMGPSRQRCDREAPKILNSLEYRKNGQLDSSFVSKGCHAISVGERVVREGHLNSNATCNMLGTTASTPLYEALPLHEDGGKDAAETQPRAARRIEKCEIVKISELGEEKTLASLNSVIEIFNGNESESEEEEETEITLLAGGSASMPAFVFRNIDGKINIIRPRPKCTATLAMIESNRLDIDKVITTLVQTEEDPILLSLIRRFILGEEPVRSVAHHKAHISRHFSTEDIAILENAKLLKNGSGEGAMPCFKVPKKDNTARFIMDCRRINDEYKNEKISMEIGKLDEVIELAQRFPFISSTDANAFFYQFPLSEKASKRFPLRLAAKRSSFSAYYLTTLPMGFKFAPAIAQRTSNMVIRRVNEWSSLLKLNGATIAWVDNFIAFGENQRTSDLLIERMLLELNNFKIKCKDVDTSNEFLGMKTTARGVQLTDKYCEKTHQAFSKFVNLPSATYNDFLIIFGHLLWANITIIRRPLCFAPYTLRLLRKAGRDQTQPIERALLEKSIPEMKEYIARLKNALPLRSWASIEPEKSWGDATPSTVAIVIEEGMRDGIAVANIHPPIEIFFAELIAAAWAIISGTTAPSYHGDNTAAAFALAKGHSASNRANAILRFIFSLNNPSKVTWVPSAKQRADGPSRGMEPIDRISDWSDSKALSSFFYHKD